MKTVLHKANSRGHADHGWLNTYHTFSFAGYYDPERIHFGALRVLNDDTVMPGKGFGKHPHDNMEIVTIPMEGDLKHGDSMGHEGIIRHGDIQVMSAGTGVVHSEFNANDDQPVKFFQIWVFPRKQNVQPRYDQIAIRDQARPNDFQQLVSPNKEDEGVWIHQDAWFYWADFQKGVKKNYQLKKEGDGVYVFVVEGSAKIGEQVLDKRDGMGVWDINNFDLEATADAKILLMEVPMTF